MITELIQAPITEQNGLKRSTTHNKPLEHTGNENVATAIREQCDRILAIDPHNTEALLLRSVCFRYLRNYPRMLQDVNTLLELSPENAKATLLRAEWLMHEGDYKGARKLILRGEDLLGMDEDQRYVRGGRLNKDELQELRDHLNYHLETFYSALFAYRL